MSAKVERPEERIGNDIRLLNENLKKLKPKNQKEEEIFDLARRYCVDAQYYLKKKDYLTAFGCINYAHGLLDAIK
ncbi:DUF357 domain-containing protein [Candidatus Micrarchaeota archaeon]|nr:DUF357 domain-containing protein [Candidatus Micrarchaeota archaeon]